MFIEIRGCGRNWLKLSQSLELLIVLILVKSRDLSNCRLLWRKKKKTFDVTSRFVMLDMRWKGLERLIRMSQVSAQGDAVFLAFSRRENPTKPYLGSKINRVAGRVVKKSFCEWHH